MRISDWSSDVCSSDLIDPDPGRGGVDRPVRRPDDHLARSRRPRPPPQDRAGAPRASRMMEEALAHYRCAGDDGTYVTVVDYRHVAIEQGAAGTTGVRHRPGARGSEAHTSALQSLLR